MLVLGNRSREYVRSAKVIAKLEDVMPRFGRAAELKIMSF